MQIKTTAPDDSDLKRVIVRLGGFHLLMSFMGAVGYIMKGSGLEDLWEIIYATASVQQMLSGHHYARALRAHFLTQHVLFILVMRECNEFTNMRAALANSYVKMCNGEVEDVTSPELRHVIKFYKEYTKKIADKNRTAKLWMQYYDMIELIRLFLRAERIGDWHLHLYCVNEMLPYFHAAGHVNYARCAHLYIQEMQTLREKLNANEYQKFIENFAIRRNDKLWAGLWSDLTIKQFLMRAMKSRGGLTRGRGITDSTVAKWIGSVTACTRVIDAMETFASFKHTVGSDQHKDFRDSSKERDARDMEQLLNYLAPRSPFRSTLENLTSIASGVCAEDTINCDIAREIGLQSITKIIGNNFHDVTIPRSNKVKTLAHMKNTCMQVEDELILIKGQQLLNRIGCAATDEDKKKEAMAYEWYPTSLSRIGGLRKSKKCTLSAYLAKQISLGSTKNVSSKIYVIDGGLLIHQVMWRQGTTYIELYSDCYKFIIRHYGAHCYVVFDGYDNICTKDHERKRRVSKRVSPNIIFENNMVATYLREEFLSNDKNKQKFFLQLSSYLQQHNITVYHAKDDADYLIVMTAVNITSKEQHVTVVSQDTDVLVLMCAHAPRQGRLSVLQPGRGNSADRELDISKVNKFLGDLKSCLLFCHAVSGCDTTSALFGKGKVKPINMVKQYKKVKDAVKIFTKNNASKSDIEKAGKLFMLKLYNAPRRIKNLNELRYINYQQTVLIKQSLGATFKIETLPPTSEAALQHSYRVYHQVQAWLVVKLPPKEWGWIRKRDMLEPNLRVRTPAPAWVLKTISCGCTSGCKSSKCSCRQVGLHCSSLCRSCQGIECTNTPPTPDNENIT